MKDFFSLKNYTKYIFISQEAFIFSELKKRLLQSLHKNILDINVVVICVHIWPHSLPTHFYLSAACRKK